MQCLDLPEFWAHGREYAGSQGNGLVGAENRTQGRTGGKNGSRIYKIYMNKQ